MDDIVKNLNELTLQNVFFRQVLETGNSMQVVIMSLKPGEDIGMEAHQNNEQVLICMSGQGKTLLNGEETDFKNGDMVLVRAGVEHNFTNTGSQEMKIITIYSPPHHEDGIVHKTKEDAQGEETVN